MSKSNVTLINFRVALSGKRGIVYRSSAPDKQINRDEVLVMLNQLSVRTFVDFRTFREHAVIDRASFVQLCNEFVFDKDTGEQLALTKSDGSRRFNILYSDFYPKEFVCKIALRQLCRQPCKYMNMLFQVYRSNESFLSMAPEIIQDHMNNIGFAEYTYSLIHSANGRPIRDLCLTLAKPDNYPVVVHCTHGKDRTGVAIALVQAMCGFSDEEIGANYQLTENCASEEVRLRICRHSRLKDEFAYSPSELIIEVINRCRFEYGSIENYLLSIGVNQTTMAKIRQILN